MSYLEEVGGGRGTFPAAYAQVIYSTCPNCFAQPMELCMNPYTGKEKSAPCVKRGRS